MARCNYSPELNAKNHRANYIDIENPNPELKTRQEDFALYVDEYDYRRGTNFLELFPQMELFYKRAKTMLVASGRPRNARESTTVATIPVSSIKRLNKAKSLFDQ